ncbi:hypothetical protein HDE77_001031 [Rhodanobacter sp. MP7CTX1]|nr:hypothetical protein [Rhodanobacter sp. MP7CTX1]
MPNISHQSGEPRRFPLEQPTLKLPPERWDYGPLLQPALWAIRYTDARSGILPSRSPAFIPTYVWAPVSAQPATVLSL